MTEILVVCGYGYIFFALFCELLSQRNERIKKWWRE